MADLVQQRLEEGLLEIQEMKKMHLFEDDELRQIIKRRTDYEYRVQRRAQVKSDYMKYIEYEMNLYSLVKLKCHRQRIKTDVRSVLYKVSQRVKRLFTQAIARFRNDVQLWMDFINFSKKLHWNSLTSNTFTSLLKVHGDKPELWIAAAKWESLENHKFHLARKLMMKGLRFNSNSKELYLELFLLELEAISTERRDAVRKKALEAQAIVTGRVKGAEQSEDHEERAELPVILSGAVAKAVYQNAVLKMPDASFVLSFIDISRNFLFTEGLTKFLYRDLIVRFSNEEIAWDAVATRPLNKIEKGMEMPFSCVEECLTIFDIAVKAVNTGKMWSLYLRFCLNQMAKLRGEYKTQLEVKVLDVFSKACDNSQLDAKGFMQWYNLASGCEDGNHRCEKILNLGLEKCSKDFDMWHARVLLTIKKGNSAEVCDVLDKALLAVKPEDSREIVSLAIRWHMATGKPDKVKQLYETTLAMPAAVSAVLKVEYIEWTSQTEGIKAAFKLFKRIWSMPPICKEIMFKMCELELTKLKPSTGHLNQIMEFSLKNFGKSDADIWIYFVKLMREHSDDIGSVARLHARAIKTLEPHLVDQFITHYTLLTTLGGF